MGASVPKRFFKTILSGGKASALRPNHVMRDPMGHGRQFSSKNRGQVKDENLIGVPTRRDAVDVSASGAGPVEITALQLGTEVVFSQVVDTGWEIVGTGDFNKDMNTDILWRNYGTGSLQGVDVVWYMNGAEFLGEALVNTVTDTNWRIAGTGDFNNDGSTDILWRNYGTGPFQGMNVVWYMNGARQSSEVLLDTVTDINWRIVNR